MAHHQSPSPGADDCGWHLEIFARNDGAEPFTIFAEALDEFAYVALDAALRRILAHRGIDLARTEWLKPIGGGLHEFRIRHDADEIERMFGGKNADPVACSTSPPRPLLLRVFVHFHGKQTVLLLSGYDKGRDPSDKRQEREISFARKHLKAWREQEARRRNATRNT